MAIYCPDCGQVLKTSSPAAATDKTCRRCSRPLGHKGSENPRYLERFFEVLFVGSVPIAIASLIVAVLLLVLSAVLLFPVQVDIWLAGVGLAPLSTGVKVFGVMLRLPEILLLGAGVTALFLLFRLPAIRRERGVF